MMAPLFGISPNTEIIGLEIVLVNLEIQAGKKGTLAKRSAHPNAPFEPGPISSKPTLEELPQHREFLEPWCEILVRADQRRDRVTFTQDEHTIAHPFRLIHPNHPCLVCKLNARGIACQKVALQLQFACTILTNCESGGLLNLALSNFIRKEFLHLEEPEATAMGFTADLEPLLGDYREDNFGTVLHLNKEGDDLILRVTLGDYSSITEVVEPTPPPARFEFIAPDAVRILEGDSKDARMEFLRDARGGQWLRASGRVYRRV
jgi:hypothetical protein